jgi:hypothetical protein
MDLAHAVWYWTVLSETDALPLGEQVRRAVPAAILAAQERVISNIAGTRRRGDADSRFWHRALEWHRGEAAWFAAHKAAFERGLR